MATEDETDQQRRIIIASREQVAAFLDLLGQLQMRVNSYVRLGLSDDQFLDDDAFIGTGTDKAAYRAAMGSIDAINTLVAAGNGTNLERFSR